MKKLKILTLWFTLCTWIAPVTEHLTAQTPSILRSDSLLNIVRSPSTVIYQYRYLTGAMAIDSVTTTVRDALPTGTWLIFNTTTSNFEGYDGTVWIDLGQSGTATDDILGGTGITSTNGSATIHGGDATIAIDLTANLDWTGVHTFQTNELQIGNSTQTPGVHYRIGGSAIFADRTVLLPLILGNDTFVLATATQILSAKTLTNPLITLPAIGATEWASANHAHAAANSGGQLGVNGAITQETFAIRKVVTLSGATDATATNWFTITTTNESGSADGGSYSVSVHLVANEAGAASGATNTAAVSLNVNWARIMASAGTGANSAVIEVGESASADEGTGAISAVTVTVTETSEFVQQVLLDVNTSGGTFDGFAVVELVYSDFTTPPVIN